MPVNHQASLSVRSVRIGPTLASPTPLSHSAAFHFGGPTGDRGGDDWHRDGNIKTRRCSTQSGDKLTSVTNCSEALVTATSKPNGVTPWPAVSLPGCEKAIACAEKPARSGSDPYKTNRRLGVELGKGFVRVEKTLADEPKREEALTTLPLDFPEGKVENPSGNPSASERVDGLEVAETMGDGLMISTTQDAVSSTTRTSSANLLDSGEAGIPKESRNTEASAIVEELKAGRQQFDVRSTSRNSF